MSPDELDDWLGDPNRRPLVVGVLNVTPDSFSDGGRFLGPVEATAGARRMVADGADWIDVGGESTRPGSDPVAAAEQLARVLPAVRAAAAAGAVVSVDTTRAEVAAAALDAGAAVVNDVSAATDDADMPAVMRRARAVVLMHMLGRPKTMQRDPQYADVVGEVEAYLLARAGAVEAAGVAPHRVVLDPGIGFGKTLRHNLELLGALGRLAGHGHPLMVGTSRKRFIGAITGEDRPERRQFGTAATVAWSVANGAALVRVHDVREMAQVVRMTRALARPDEAGA